MLDRVTRRFNASSGRSPWRHDSLLIAVALAALAPLQPARAVSPPPDGGYPGQNTAEGDFALNSLVGDQAIDNTAVGFQALKSLASGNLNTAVGFGALANDTANNNTAIGAQALQNKPLHKSNVKNLAQSNSLKDCRLHSLTSICINKIYENSLA